MILIVDNYDSFTHNLSHRTPGEVRVVRNDAVDRAAIAAMEPAGIILGPGPGHPAKPRDIGVGAELLEHPLDVPMLGVCLGMQAMALHAGAKIIEAPRIVHGEATRVKLMPHPLFQGIRETDVGRYHSLAVDSAHPPKDWQVLAAADGMVMAMAHQAKPWVGVQFHPESILSPDGQKMLENFSTMTENR